VRGRQLLIPLLVFVLTTLGSLANFPNRLLGGGEDGFVIPTTLSIVRHGDTDLDEYPDLVAADIQHVALVHGHEYSMWPLGPVLISVPSVLVADRALPLLFRTVPALERYARSRVLHSFSPSQSVDVLELCNYIGFLVASLVFALATTIIYLIARLSLGTGFSLLVAFVFAFCTSAWSTASRSIGWQHGPSMLMLAAALFVILKARSRPWLVQFAGLPLAFSFVVRPTNAIAILLLTVYVVVEYRRYFFRYILWTLPVVIPFLLYNLRVYDALLSPYYLDWGTHGRLLKGLAGTLVSPSRGLLVYTPVLLLSLLGVVLKLRDRCFTKLDTALLATLLLHWVMISAWRMWWGGFSFGPRFFTDVLPFFVYFLIPVVAKIGALRGPRKIILGASFAVLAAVSFFVHSRAVLVPEVHLWNEKPVSVDLQPSRVWDWHDIQFLRGIRHVPIGDPLPEGPHE
jgi:hypothetical protein